MYFKAVGRLYLYQLRKLLILKDARYIQQKLFPIEIDGELLTQLVLNFLALLGREPSGQLSPGTIEGCHAVRVE